MTSNTKTAQTKINQGHTCVHGVPHSTENGSFMIVEDSLIAVCSLLTWGLSSSPLAATSRMQKAMGWVLP